MRFVSRLAAAAAVLGILGAGPVLAEGAPPVKVLAAGDVAYCELTWPDKLIFRLIGRDPKPQRGAPKTARLLDRLEGSILILGDLAYRSGTAEEFRDCYDPTWGRHKARSYPAPGNHEYRTHSAKPYFDYWGPRAGEPGRGYYSFDLGAWHIISLNSNIKTKAGSKQYRWLQRDLAATEARCILAFWHHPVFSTGHGGDDMTMAPLYRLLHQAGASIVLGGHDHNYERLAPLDAEGMLDWQNGIRNFVVGTGGAPGGRNDRGWRRWHSEVIKSEVLGVLELTLYEDRYSWTFVPVEGQSFTDSGSESCVPRHAGPQIAQ